VADGWCWFVLREKYCWLVAGGWFVLREKYCWLVADKPSEQADCLEGWIPLGCSDYKLKLFILGVVLWILWTTRNKFAIEGGCPTSPADVVHKILSYLQRWRLLLKGEQARMDARATQIRSWLACFREKLRSSASPEDGPLINPTDWFLCSSVFCLAGEGHACAFPVSWSSACVRCVCMNSVYLLYAFSRSRG
jgi:hypothetical protein